MFYDDPEDTPTEQPADEDSKEPSVDGAGAAA
jgi:hypothetical protein